ncbi:MAG TPA: hypothetical protein VIR81_15560 [Myxococcales bacterium]|nr:hypothetical protein [Myxococcales bacterium]
MSHEPSHSTEHMAPPPLQAEEAISWFKVIGTGLGALILFAIATWISWRFMNARERALQPLPLGPAAAAPLIGEQEINIVDQVPFDVTRRVQTYRRERIERLSSWGWMDKKAGTIHMPIGRAMDLVIQDQKDERKEEQK